MFDTSKLSTLTNSYIKFFLGVLMGSLFTKWYFNFTEKIDGRFGTRNRLVRSIDLTLDVLKTVVENQETSETYRNVLLNEIDFFQDLKQKIMNLKLIYFLSKKNEKSVNEISSIVRDYSGPDPFQKNDLKQNLTTLDTLNFICF